MADVTTATPELRLERVNTPPAQTWNYLRANDITLTVPNESRKGDVYFALPRLFEGIDCGMGPDVTAWIESQAADAQYVEVRAGEKRTEPILASMDTGIMVRAGAEATIVVCPEAATPGPKGSTPIGSLGPKGSIPIGAPGPKGSTPIGAPGPKGSIPIGATSGALVRVIAEKGAHVRLFEFVAVDDDQQHVESVGITADEGARVEVRQYFLGAHTTAAGLSCALNGANARFDLTCRYLGTGDQRLDINHVVSMRGRNGRSNLRESGVLDGRAHKTLRATIDLVHGSSGSEGAELENVLVLSDDVVNKTMPVILCDEDDVAGNHGATIGSVGPDQIQYLADRGLSLEEAEALYVRALFDEALIAAPTAAVRTAVLARAQTVLGPEVAGDLVEALQLDAEDQA